MRTRLSYSPASSSSTGATCLHGPHHSAQKSTTTGTGDLSTSCSKFALFSFTILSAVINQRSIRGEIRNAAKNQKQGGANRSQHEHDGHNGQDLVERANAGGRRRIGSRTLRGRRRSRCRPGRRRRARACRRRRRVAGAGAAARGAAGAAARRGAAAPPAVGGPPGASVGNLMVGAEVGLGGKLMRTVSFLGWTLAASAGLGGVAPPGRFGMFSGIVSFCANRLELPPPGVKSGTSPIFHAPIMSGFSGSAASQPHPLGVPPRNPFRQAHFRNQSNQADSIPLAVSARLPGATAGLPAREIPARLGGAILAREGNVDRQGAVLE